MQTIQEWVQHLPNINARRFEGATALHLAAACNKPRIIELLISKEADVNIQDLRGQTPLMFSVTFAAYDALQALIKCHADPDIVNNSGQTVFDMAAISNERIVSILNKAFPSKSHQFDTSATVYYLLHEQKLKELLTSQNEPTSLFDAMLLGDETLVQKLISNGADVDEKNEIGYTPLGFAINLMNLSIANILINNGADINKSSLTTNMTPLMIAVHEGNNLEVIKFLIIHGADINKKNKLNETALDIAIEMKNLKLICLLLENATIELIHNSKKSNELISLLKKSNMSIFKENEKIIKILRELSLEHLLDPSDINSSKRKIIKKCSNSQCLNLGNHKCSLCKNASYCSRECQKTDWPSHKIICKKKQLN